MTISVLAQPNDDLAGQFMSPAALLDHLRRVGIRTALEALDRCIHQGLLPSSEAFVPVLIELWTQLLAQFNRDARSSEGYAVLDQLGPDLAQPLFHTLMQGIFPNGIPDLANLNDSAVVVLGGLLSASGEHANAVGFLGELAGQRQRPGLQYALWRAQCRGAGCSQRIMDYWPPAPPLAALDQNPLDVAIRRARARSLIERDLFADGVNDLAIGLSLPIEDDAKSGLATDLAVVAAYLFARGEGNVIEQQRVQWALAAYPALALLAVEFIDAALGRGGLPFLDEGAARRVKQFFQVCAGELVATALAPSARLRTPYPTRNGKPHMDTVWLEITNFCNQKCSFCPDPFREAARSWLPLDQVKKLIDELADTLSVGSMQLNAYGEPLLHPHIAEILAYIREKQLPWPTFFTSHGMTLVDKKLKQLSHNYPAGIAISLHNDSQQSYEATRSAKIGDYDTLVSRVTNLVRQMVFERASSHLRLYQMVCNGNEAQQVDVKTRDAFPDSPERMLLHVRKWESIAAEIVASVPPGVRADAPVNSEASVAEAFHNASHGDGNHLPIIRWLDQNGRWQQVFMSARPVGTYANLLLEYDPKWKVKREVVNRYTCSFTRMPSLAIFATGRLGICCLDLNSTATFGSLSDFGSLREAVESPAAMRMFAELSNGVATSAGCQICLASDGRLCRID